MTTITINGVVYTEQDLVRLAIERLKAKTSGKAA
jgi:hypothetical protein